MTCRFRGLVSVLSVVLLAASAGHASQIVADFDDLTLAPNSHKVGDQSVNTFTTNGVQFSNNYDSRYGSWNGFAHSNRGDTTTAGYGNQFSAFAGSGRGPGADNFGVAFGYTDTVSESTVFTLPTLVLPTGGEIQGLYVTNMTYAALSMRDGDSFAKKFSQGDWFKLTAYGTDATGKLLANSVSFDLVDYTSSTAADWTIVNDWRYMDLSSLAGASKIHFNLASSDVGFWGMNTPATFAVDDITYSVNQTAVPEPSSLALLGMGALVAGIAVQRRRRAG